MAHTNNANWVSVADVAEEWGLSVRTVYRMIDEGTLEGCYITPRALRVSRKSMDALLARNAA